MLLDGGLQFEERRVSDRKKKKRRDNKKEKEQRERRTHHSGVWRKMVAHNIGITGHGMLSSKAIKAISIHHPMEMRRISWLTSSKLLLLQVFHHWKP